MTLAELGSQFRDERLTLDLSVEDVAARLKIPSRILRAIEDGNMKDLPHTVYTRGFIKGYGAILGYPNDKITELLDALEGFDEDFSPPKTVEIHPMTPARAPSSRSRLSRFVIALLVMGVLGGGAYYYFATQLTEHGPEETAAAPASPSIPGQQTPPLSAPATPSLSPATPPAAEPPLAEPPVSEPSRAEPSTAGSPAPVPGAAVQQPLAETPPPLSAAPTSEADPVTTRGFAPLAETPETTPSASSASSSPGQSHVAPPPGMQQIVLTAEADCWVHANADGTEMREFTLKSGETFAMPFRKTLLLKLGNAGGVRIKYNGEDMPPAGTPGQVKTITFPPQR